MSDGTFRSGASNIFEARAVSSTKNLAKLKNIFLSALDVKSKQIKNTEVEHSRSMVIENSGEYSKLGARGKDFQNLMFSKKNMALITYFPFSAKIEVISKKKGLQFNLISLFAIFLPKSRWSLKKRFSLRIDLLFPTFRPNSIMISKKHKRQNETK